VFTINRERFPEPDALLRELKELGIKAIPIIDPGVKVDEQYEIYREGKKGGYFCRDEHGADFIGAVWPGEAVYPDFFNAKTRQWWAAHIKEFLELGFSGIWNDMNEPAIFYTPAELEKCIAQAAQQTGALTLAEYFGLRDAFKQLANRDEYYYRFYHITDNGEKVRHAAVHNLYGYYMAKATAAAVAKAAPAAAPACGVSTTGGAAVPVPAAGQPRLFILSRSNCVGLHRLAAIWTGDNHSWWEHMFQNIQMLISLNMCGFLFAGADVGGFGGNASAELVIRWTQLGVFNPLFRNHSAAGTRVQEPYAFDSETTTLTRQAIELRYALLPYLYSEMLAAVLHLTPFVKPLCFEFTDKISQEIEDEFLVGNTLLVAPVHKANIRARFVYLPAVKWLHWKVADYRVRNCQVYRPGTHHITAELAELPLFLRENSMLLLTPHQNYVGEKAVTELTIIAFVTRQACYTYYDDDGTTLDYRLGRYAMIDFTVAKDEDDFKVRYTVHPCASVPLTLTHFYFEIYDEHGRIFKKQLACSGLSGECC
jgi:alpha-glucosidase